MHRIRRDRKEKDVRFHEHRGIHRKKKPPFRRRRNSLRRRMKKP
jgi:hypothetical protein